MSTLRSDLNRREQIGVRWSVDHQPRVEVITMRGISTPVRVPARADSRVQASGAAVMKRQRVRKQLQPPAIDVENTRPSA
jgi:alpha-galactosidase